MTWVKVFKPVDRLAFVVDDGEKIQTLDGGKEVLIPRRGGTLHTQIGPVHICIFYDELVVEPAARDHVYIV